MKTTTAMLVGAAFACAGTLTFQAIAQDSGGITAPPAATSSPDGAHTHLQLEQRLADAEQDILDQLQILESFGRRIKALEEAKPPEAPPPPPTVFTLVPGAGAEPNPEPESVDPHNAAFPITEDVRSASIAWGSSLMALNYYDNTDSGPLARVVEWSLDGGPWLGTRNGLIRVPADLPDGSHQLRTVMFPISGLSQPQPIHTLTKATVGGIVFWDYR